MNQIAKITLFVLFIVSCGQQETGFYAESQKPRVESNPIVPISKTDNIIQKENPTAVPSPLPSPIPTAAPSEAPANTAIPSPSPIPTVAPPVPCTELPKTNAILKTASVNQKKSKRLIEYNISVLDCNGNPMALQANYFMYDFDAFHQETSEMTGIIKFKITNPADEQEISGDMLKVKGSDLFNRKGSQWEHYRTDKLITFAKPTKVFELQIDMSQIWIVSPISASSYTPEGFMLIATFLKFGDSIPVQGDVIFQ